MNSIIMQFQEALNAIIQSLLPCRSREYYSYSSFVKYQRRKKIKWSLLRFGVILMAVPYLLAFSHVFFVPDSFKKMQGKIREALQPASVGICLVGGARDFHLTGPSIVANLLGVFPSAHVFLNSPLDQNAHFLSILKESIPQLVHIRIVPDVPVNETDLTDFVLRWVRSGPEYVTRQQLLQQFKAVEFCTVMIARYEKEMGRKYKWILRTRVDGFWSKKSPKIEDLDPYRYTIPDGADWGGVNDRLSVGPRDASWLGLKRLSVLRQLAESGFKSLNAERAYQAQLQVLNVSLARRSFPFCVLSQKKAHLGFPVAASLSSRAYLNGGKCRPCVPAKTGKDAELYLTSLPRERAFGPTNTGVDICEAKDGWEDDWEYTFDHTVSDPKAVNSRKYMSVRPYNKCVEDVKALQASSVVWDAPPPAVICVRSFMGPVQKVGFPGGDWPVLLSRISPSSVVYSVTTGDNYSWDHHILKRRKATVHSFDGTPHGFRWISDHMEILPHTFIHHPWSISPTEEALKLYPLDLVDRPFQYSLELPNNLVKDSVPLPIEVESKSLEKSMAELGHNKVDLLRFGGHWSIYEAIFEEWISRGKTPPVCQVLISFHKDDQHFGSEVGDAKLEALRKIGLELGICIQQGAIPSERDYYTCLFFSTLHCFS